MTCLRRCLTSDEKVSWIWLQLVVFHLFLSFYRSRLNKISVKSKTHSPESGNLSRWVTSGVFIPLLLDENSFSFSFHHSTQEDHEKQHD